MREKGAYRDMEHIESCRLILEEKGVVTPGRKEGEEEYHEYKAPFHAKMKTVFPEETYLSRRRRQLSSLMQEIRPHLADCTDLVVTGINAVSQSKESDIAEIIKWALLATLITFSSRNPTEDCHSEATVSSRSSTIDEASLGSTPALKIGDTHQAVFSDGIDTHCFTTDDLRKSTTADAISVVFEKIRNLSHIDKTKRTRNQKFFLPLQRGTLKPGQSVQIPISFLSLSEGVYSELWSLQTEPTLSLSGGRPIILSLFGISVWPSSHRYHSWELEHHCTKIESIATQNFIDQLIEDVIFSFPEPGPPETLRIIGNQNTEFDRFSIQNPELKELYKKVLKDSASTSETVWDLDLKSLKEVC
ncbi:hypothetical protein Ciccas_008476 [Cichlidogyrus casuarinus]|uniref:Uncharacterized protein n=1 Tax=Cichlidogyrus casuarinus TaxID=1844966 RepID=A0ABD2Q0N4_9PLAT